MNNGFIVAIAGAALLFVAAYYSLRIIYNYRIGNRAVEIVVFGRLPVYRLGIDNIESIQLTGSRELGVGGTLLRLGNRFSSESVIITKRRGWFRRVVITPNNPDQFINQVKSLQAEAADERNR